MKSPLIKNSLLFILFFFSTNLFSQSYEDLKKDIINFSSIKSDLNLDGKPDVIFYNKWLGVIVCIFLLIVKTNTN